MICSTCNSETSHVKVVHSIEYCSNCSGISENRATEDIITRASSRIRIESVKYEGDMLNPQKYDKSTKKVVPNEEFLKLHGIRAKNFFSESDLNVGGYRKLSRKIREADIVVRKEKSKLQRSVLHEGDKKERIQELLV